MFVEHLEQMKLASEVMQEYTSRGDIPPEFKEDTEAYSRCLAVMEEMMRPMVEAERAMKSGAYSRARVDVGSRHVCGRWRR